MPRHTPLGLAPAAAIYFGALASDTSKGAMFLASSFQRSDSMLRLRFRTLMDGWLASAGRRWAVSPASVILFRLRSRSVNVVFACDTQAYTS